MEENRSIHLARGEVAAIIESNFGVYNLWRKAQQGNDISLQADEPFYWKNPFKPILLPPQELNQYSTLGKGPAHQNCRKVISPWPNTTHCPRIAAKEKCSMGIFFILEWVWNRPAARRERKVTFKEIHHPQEWKKEEEVYLTSNSGSTFSHV